MRIGIACYPTYGGSGVVATELGLALAEIGHEVHFLAYEPPIRLTSFHSNIFYHQVGVPDYPLFRYPPYALSLATKMAEVVDQYEIQLLHVHYAIPHAASAWMAKEMVAPRKLGVVVTLHGTDITIVGQDASYKRVTRFTLDRADGVTTVSNYLRDETRRVIETNKKIEVIPNFIDLNRFDAHPCPDAQALHGENDELLLVHTSNFRPVKRVGDVVEAMALVAREVPVKLLLIGDGPDRPAVEDRVKELGLAKKVSFLGSQESVERILPCADVFVLPSIYESFGLAALEAMASGLPVVATNTGGIPEVVEDGVTGFLVSPRNPKALARAIREMALDPDRRRAMGQAARARAEELFDIRKILPIYVAHYERVLEGLAGRSQAAVV
ncbi:MAG TPA: N-acetyl-alpha-D-glucosaminyl L-malate synthase BshA [Planctomycetes bacterium]|nr:N-acetyl-alpha-D-glucosaminyl L-malate synthase BshA [Planctomycetota bacterium]